MAAAASVTASVTASATGSESTTCALVPPKPKAETAPRRGSSPRGHSRPVRTSVSSPTRPSLEATGRSTPMVGGMWPLPMARMTLSMLLSPATVRRWPMLPLTEPISGTLPASPKNAATESASVESPMGVPVAWHSR